MNTQFEGLLAAAHARDTLSAARILADNGLQVFPCRPTKAPYTPSGFKDASSDPAVIAGWWNQWPNALIGLPTGIVSGLVVVDVDVKNGRNGFRGLVHRELGCTFATETPSGGMHFFYRHPGGVVRNSASKFADGVDVRGDGGYVIFPPSSTVDGCYSLAIPSIICNLPEWVHGTEKEEATSMASILSNISVISDISVVSVLSVPQVLSRTQPMQEGERNRCLLNLARGLKYESGLKNQPLEVLLPIVRQWHELAFPVIGTKSFTDTLSDFRHAWKHARLPLTFDAMQAAVGYANANPVPVPMWVDDDKTRVLFTALLHLADQNGGVFFASCRKLSQLIAMPPITVSRRLRLFEEMGVIETVEKHTEYRATRYRWKWLPTGTHSSVKQIAAVQS
jgi:hypothetical protein